MSEYVFQLHLHAKYSHKPNMSQGRTSPGLPYASFKPGPSEVSVRIVSGAYLQYYLR